MWGAPSLGLSARLHKNKKQAEPQHVPLASYLWVWCEQLLQAPGAMISLLCWTVVLWIKISPLSLKLVLSGYLITETGQINNILYELHFWRCYKLSWLKATYKRIYFGLQFQGIVGCNEGMEQREGSCIAPARRKQREHQSHRCTLFSNNPHLKDHMLLM